MGVESGGGGEGRRVPRSRKISGDVPPEIMIFQYLFLGTYATFPFSNILKIKSPKSDEKLNFGGRRVWVPNFHCP